MFRKCRLQIASNSWTPVESTMVGQGAIYVTSYLCMVARHMCLSALFQVQIEETHDISRELGGKNMTYLHAYCVGNMLNGHLNDRFSIRLVVPIGMLLAGVCYYLIAIFTDFNWLYVVLFGCCGLAQSTVWSGTLALMSNWFVQESRGKVLGSWSSNANFGNILGSLTVAVMSSPGNQWHLIVVTETTLLCIIALLFFVVARDRPEEQLAENKSAISFCEALQIPGVCVYAVDFAFVKLLNYGMLFWLPYFLVNHLHVDGLQRGLVAASYDVGAVFGSAVTGWASDRVGSRPLVLAPMLTLSIPLFYCLRLGKPVWPYFILLPLLGWTVGASANVLYSAGAADLAKLQNNYGLPVESTATIAGIIDGTGSLGAGLGWMLIGSLVTSDSTNPWDPVFYFLMGKI